MAAPADDTGQAQPASPRFDRRFVAFIPSGDGWEEVADGDGE
jgi:hypothetical protein